jgi:hypothetical protein
LSAESQIFRNSDFLASPRLGSGRAFVAWSRRRLHLSGFNRDAASLGAEFLTFALRRAHKSGALINERPTLIAGVCGPLIVTIMRVFGVRYFQSMEARHA